MEEAKAMKVTETISSLTDEECKSVIEISKRAREIGLLVNDALLIMDVLKTHTFLPLDLVKFAKSPLADFTHDICGIFRELDRDTGSLGTFLPRCAKA